MSKPKLPRCYKCRARTVSSCQYCGDPVCYYHALIYPNGKKTCSPCDIKYYMIWREEKDEEHTTELAYLEWLKQKVKDEQGTTAD